MKTSMTETFAAAVVVHHADTTILQCSPNSELFFSLPEEQLVGKKLGELNLYYVREDGTQLTPEELPVNRVALQKCSLSDIIVGIYSEASMSLIWTRVEAHPELDNKGNIKKITTTYTDITDITEQKLAASLSLTVKEEWEKTFDAMQDVVTILSPEYQIIRANRATYTILELDYVDLAGKYCYDIFHGRTAPCDHCPISHSLPKAKAYTGLVYNARIDKTLEVTSSPVIDSDGTIKFLVQTARDVTQRLKDESERIILSAAIDQTTEAVIITDIKGIIQYVNPSCLKTTGYARHEILGQDYKFLNLLDHSDDFFDQMWDTLQNGDVWKGRLINRKKDGTLFEENATISPIFDNYAQISNFVAVKRDVTKEELLERQLQQAMKMEAMGTLAGGIAHDFNNILSAMIGYGQIVKGRLAKDDPIQEDIEQILTAGDRAANLVKQILTFSRRDNNDSFRPLQIQFIIKEVLKLLRSSLPTTIKLNHNIDQKCQTILADPGQIHQVLMNLCTNAKQAIGGDYGVLTLELKQIDVKEPRIVSSSSLLATGPYLELTVKDTGSGMSSDIVKKIFDPFFTTKPLDQGTGLGLSVVHGIVKKHGGEILVESRINEGTTFQLFFPVVEEDKMETSDSKEQEYRGSERIMVVDDEEVVAKVITKILSKLGYKTTFFSDSLEAVKEFRAHPHNYDVIITDMTMPNMTGAELSREMLSLRPELPVIMTTGYSEIMNKEKAEIIGIREFLLKPIKNTLLSKVVRRVIDEGKDTSS